MIGWLLGGLLALIVIVAVWETFAPFVKSILDKYVYRYFRCFVKYVRGKFFGEVVLDGARTYEKEIDESEVPEKYRYVKYSYTGRVDVTDDEELQLQL
ncbi:MAG: hypothetical protein IJG51_03510 [Synergistaceae bacterium]|nr:hypothetical protein [Synergistaceae bacterium]MBQ6419214.1 hypothetical protein [Synergistaceae bacterium]